MPLPNGHLRKCRIRVPIGQLSGDESGRVWLLSETDLPGEMLTSGGSNAARSGGEDVRFSTDEAGTNQLACDVIIFEQAADPADAKVAIAVGPIDEVAAADNDIWVWYDDPTTDGDAQPAVGDAFGRNAVWSGFLFVLHLTGDPTGSAPQVVDRSGNGRDGTAQSTWASGDLIDAPFGRAWNWGNGSSKYISHAMLADYAGEFTLLTYVTLDAPDGGTRYVAANVGATLRNYVGSSTAPGWCWLRAGSGNDANLVQVNETIEQWNVFGSSREDIAGNARLTQSQNGTIIDQVDRTGMSAIPSGTWYTGGNDGGLVIDGALGFQWCHSTALSTNWRAALSANLSSPATFFDVGTPADVSGGGGASTDGAIGESQSEQTGSAAGTVAASGALTETSSDQVGAASATVATAGSITELEPEQASATTALISTSAALTESQSQQTSSATGNASISAELTESASEQISSGEGTVAQDGLFETQSEQIESASGTVSANGSISETQAQQTDSLGATVPLMGSQDILTQSVSVSRTVLATPRISAAAAGAVSICRVVSVSVEL